jgi:hypothetical protein
LKQNNVLGIIAEAVNPDQKKVAPEPQSAVPAKPKKISNIKQIQETKMRTEKIELTSIGAVFAAFLLTAFALVASASAQQINCASKPDTLRVVALEAAKGTDAVFNFPNDGVGHFSSTPLLAAVIDVGGVGRSCVLARFSAEAMPLDNHIVYQVRLDGVAMRGHLPDFIGIASPVIADAEETDLNLERLVAHDFFAVVEPGRHRVEVFFAGCCSGAPPPVGPYGFSGANVLALQFTGNLPAGN